MITLRGSTWAHSRGYAPLAATAQVYNDLHPDVTIIWEQRSLWAFGEAALNDLAANYDLIVFDHPFTGMAAQDGLLVALDGALDATLLGELAAGSVGPSYRSYSYGGKQWALPIDAAAQVAALRPDLLAALGCAPPQSWAEVLDLARSSGRVAVPLTQMGAWACFLTLCANLGQPALQSRTAVVDRAVGEQVLAQIAELYSLVAADCLNSSPIALLNRMASDDSIAYIPLIYGYTNYAREGYARQRLSFANIPLPGQRGANLGGAGIGISVRCAQQNVALNYIQWLAGPECQRTLYTLSGGQPAQAAAWDDELANMVTNDFFRATRATLEAAFLRPNFPHFPGFQTRAGQLLHAFLKGEARASATLQQLDDAYAAANAAAAP
jgi:multiple sugar transport system substrate-binding protein